MIGVLHSFKATSGCITIVITVERCLCVMNPFNVSFIIQTKTAALLVIFIFFFFQLCYLITPFSFQAVVLKVDGRVFWTLVPTALYQDNKIYVCFIFLGTVVPVISFIVILISTVCTVVKLRAAVLWRETTAYKKNRNDSQQVALTTILLLVACVYVITMFPTIVRQLMFTFYPGCSSNQYCYDVFMAFSAIVFSVASVNNSFYFFIYYSRSSKFRLALDTLIFRCKS